MHGAVDAAPKAGATTGHRRGALVSAALNVGALAGVVCILFAALSASLGVSPLVFRSGSMAPEITTGSLAFAKSVPGSEIRVGDIITVADDRGESITHRVMSVADGGGGAVSVTLKGDANPVEDPAPYTITEAKRVFFHLPALGFVAAWMSSTTMVFLAGLLAGILIMVAFGPARPGEPSDESTTQEPSDA
ncbi:signal peptidase I [Dietzia sp. B32]|uniref:signal peptidase I n=1 Tax=Dietzia sp. B32 TaxID=2915130 RepID=UPI0021AD7190|nr:signal peptidase I [Dietzia sp. B32]UVE96949.1 signal peptidase I [Dietzia sp. B32]